MLTQTPHQVGIRFSSDLSGRYRVEREIGRGGMATVYLAHDTSLDRPVAVKVLDTSRFGHSSIERFMNEIRVSGRLQHEHLVPVFDSGEIDGDPFYIMPYVDGGTLRDVLDKGGPLPVDDVVRIAREIAGALHHAHEQGVVHRDLKPENILMRGGHALLTDFGIALSQTSDADGRLTQAGTTLGTPHYMSPEQAMGCAIIDRRSDVYSLGAIMYEMLTGVAPHAGGTAQAVVARLIGEEPRRLRLARPSAPARLEYIVHRALAKTPADRFSTAAELEQMLAAIGGEDGVSQPSKAVPKWRHAAQWVAAAAIAGAVAGSIAACVAIR